MIRVLQSDIILGIYDQIYLEIMHIRLLIYGKKRKVNVIER